MTIDLMADVLYKGSAKVAFESTHDKDGLKSIAFVLVLLPPMYIALLSVHCMSNGDTAGGA